MPYHITRESSNVTEKKKGERIVLNFGAKGRELKERGGRGEKFSGKALNTY
jgi:hypothetical protein